MSSRALKKLVIKIKEPPSDYLDDELESDSDFVPTKKQLNINRYDLLNQASPSESEIKEDDDTERGDSYGFYNGEQAKKKKKKRKKKRTGKNVSQRKSSEDNADVEDDISRTVREVEKLFGATTTKSNVTNAISNDLNGSISLLMVQHKHLNPSNEMKRMFGNRVVQAEQSKRRNVRGVQRFLRSTWLVNPKENWPPVGKTGIYMNLVASPNLSSTSTHKPITDKNAIYFTFEHSPAYRQLQQKFLTAVETMDSDNIINIINQQPYHIDSLIQLSELCKMSEDFSMASELIEHAIYALESSFHSMFSIVSGTSRLEYRRQENRSFFILLFKHSQFLESRACSRTALEIAKFLLTLDPDNDPLAVILMADFYAIRAKQFDWLIQLFEEWEESHSLSQLPNMAYSYALALFYSRKLDEADKALQYALLMFPAVLRLLIDELSIQADPRLLGHKYFSSIAYSQQRLPLQQLTSLYVTRCKSVWRHTDILPWLERNVSTVLDQVDENALIVRDFEEKRNSRYIHSPRPILRHIILSDFKGVPLAQALSNESSTAILMYDPLPPPDSIDIYTRPDVNRTSTALLNGSPLSMFFQSLLPSFNLQGQGVLQGENQRAAEIALENEGAAGGIQTYAELRTSLNSIVDAMRDFLSNIRVPERPNDADVDENEESSDDEPNDYLT